MLLDSCVVACNSIDSFLLTKIIVWSVGPLLQTATGRIYVTSTTAFVKKRIGACKLESELCL